jgi:2-polyprenyl-6-methoxyphenol hydroxylase-like FAD-dependent oxidoreductase
VPNVNITFRSQALESRDLCARAIHYWVIGRTRGGLMGRLDLDGTWWAIVQGVEHPEASIPSRCSTNCAETSSISKCVRRTPGRHARCWLTARRRSHILVGDAAHLNPPWGGHGFNTCVGDAVNIAWKLAARLRGWGGPHLMTSYELERRPIAKRTLEARRRKKHSRHLRLPRQHSSMPCV